MFGVPRVVITDHGSEFTSKEFYDLCCRLGIRHLPTSPYSPTSNGLNERTHPLLQHAIKRRAPVTSSTPIADLVSEATLVSNAMPHQALKSAWKDFMKDGFIEGCTTYWTQHREVSRLALSGILRRVLIE
eukprot:GHVP01037489.1.p1 GENE.GHVP01037489.1~~GHVP01037489.1.p1  ORF type:complete len:130 (+),score=6.33 GHVP01037489.1:223-612(+)